MKKVLFTLACITGLMFFASCDPELMEQNPKVEFVSEDGYVSDFSGYWVNTELKFKFKATPNGITGNEIKSVHFAITDLNGNTVKTADPVIGNPGGENVFEETFVSSDPSIYTVTVTVTDAADLANAVYFTVDYVLPIESPIGKFTGKVILAGNVKTDKPVLGNNIDQNFSTDSLYTEITMGQVEGGKVIATFEIDGRPVSLYCTQDGDHFVYDKFKFDKLIDFMVCKARLIINVDAESDLVNDKLTLSGTVTGSGKVINALLNPTATLHETTINGVFHRVATE